MIVTLLALFAAPWTIAGLIHAPAAGMRGHSRGRIFGTGLAIFLVLMTVGVILHAPSQGAAPSSSTMTLAGLWMISMVAWPLAALIMRTRSRHAAVSPPTPAPAAKPWEGEKPKLLTTEQRQSLELEPAPTLTSAPEPPTAWNTEQDDDEDRFAGLCPEPVNPCAVAFLYENAQGEISNREVIIDKVGTSHFAGLCKLKLEDRMFRFDRIIGLATLTESGEEILPRKLRNLLRGYTQSELRRSKQAAAKIAPEILFTGFKKDRRAELEAIAQAAGMVIRKNVTTQLDFLCAGSNAGPTKLAEARERGTQVLDEQQLLQMLETGEVPA